MCVWVGRSHWTSLICTVNTCESQWNVFKFQNHKSKTVKPDTSEGPCHRTKPARLRWQWGEPQQRTLVWLFLSYNFTESVSPTMMIRKFWLETLNLYSVLCSPNPLETPCPAWLSLSHLVSLVGFVVCLVAVDVFGVVFLSWPCVQSSKQETQALSPSKCDNEVGCWVFIVRLCSCNSIVCLYSCYSEIKVYKIRR